MDTTSNALSRVLHLLAYRPETQEKLRQEFLEAQDQHGLDIPHDELMALPFLDAICRETLRLYPPAPVLARGALKDAILPLSAPIKGLDGREMHEIAIAKDTVIFFSIMNINTDPVLWGPDAQEWKPERWLAPLPEALVEARIPGVYSNLLTFGGGTRSCIGFKLSQMEMKVLLSVLISQFRFSPAKGEIFWEMGPITVPALKDNPGKAILPLTVELLA
ncbi:hypothetical protein H0H81_002377 [Sphagnurus paluster]|uniref:Cytochrome P450 n=1 Tax=Sphagnurus paluster TaxID=117069 RepID=A0A9P7FM58_9AGAR|nr:hypothetical protein H0H81_002377 [Sphagnurus paluster]